MFKAWFVERIIQEIESDEKTCDNCGNKRHFIDLHYDASASRIVCDNCYNVCHTENCLNEEEGVCRGCDNHFCSGCVVEYKARRHEWNRFVASRWISAEYICIKCLKCEYSDLKKEVGDLEEEIENERDDYERQLADIKDQMKG